VGVVFFAIGRNMQAESVTPDMPPSTIQDKNKAYDLGRIFGLMGSSVDSQQILEVGWCCVIRMIIPKRLVIQCVLFPLLLLLVIYVIVILGPSREYDADTGDGYVISEGDRSIRLAGLL